MLIGFGTLNIFVFPSRHHDSCTLFFFLLIAVLMSLSTLGSCRFVSYSNSMPINSASVNNLIDDAILAEGISIISTAELGLISWNPENSGCVRYGNPDKLSKALKVARVSGVSASLFAMTSLFIIVTEFFCCRFCCSRCMTITLLLIAAACQATTFSAYASDVCVQSSIPYSCNYNLGSTFAISAMVLMIASSFLACSAPKTRPVARMLMELEHSPNDPCCYCFRKDKLNIPEQKLDDKNKVNDIESDYDEEQEAEDFHDADRDFVGEDVAVPANVTGSNAAAPLAVYGWKEQSLAYSNTARSRSNAAVNPRMSKTLYGK